MIQTAEAVLFAYEPEQDDQPSLLEIKRAAYTKNLFEELSEDDNEIYIKQIRTDYFESVAGSVSLRILDILESETDNNGDIKLADTPCAVSDILPSATVEDYLSAQMSSIICVEAKLRVKHGYQDVLLNQTPLPKEQNNVVDKIEDIFQSDGYNQSILQLNAAASLEQARGTSHKPIEYAAFGRCWALRILTSQDFIEVGVVQKLMPKQQKLGKFINYLCKYKIIDRLVTGTLDTN